MGHRLFLCLFAAFQSSVVPRRRRLTVPRRVLASSRRVFEPAVGLVALRGGGGGRAASRSRASSFWRASSRLASRMRWRSAVMISSPSRVIRRPARAASLCFTASDKLGDAIAAKRSCTAVSSLFTFCPPGPEAREKLSFSSCSAMAMVGVIRIMRLT